MEVSEVPEAPKGQRNPESPEVSPEATDPEAAPRARRRGRTSLLVAGAAVLGLFAGTCAGYLVQADRDPTKLPPLSQPTLAQAEGKGPEPLSAKQDRKVKVNGDLRELLLTKPSGAKDADYLGDDDGWMNLATYAHNFEKPEYAFSDFLSKEFRRVAVTGWDEGDDYAVEIRLAQFHQEETLGARESTDDDHYWAGTEKAVKSWLIPGTGDGRAYVYTQPESDPGYLPYYTAEAHAWRGDIEMEIWMVAAKPVPKAKIMDLAKRQMERL